MNGRERFLTVKQPWASLIMAGAKDVENRPKAVPSTLPHWIACNRCSVRRLAGSRWGDDCTGQWSYGGQHMLVDVGPFPFRLWIHAGKGYDHDGRTAALTLALHAGITVDAGRALMAASSSSEQGIAYGYPRGVLLGHVTITGCHHADDPICEDTACERGLSGCDGDEHYSSLDATCSPWAQCDAFHWTLADPVALPEPIPMRGQQGLPFMPDDVLASALAQLEGVPA